MSAPVLITDHSRVFIQRGGSSPTNPLEYKGQAMAESLDWKQGDIKPVRDPSPSQYGNFDTIAKILGDPSLPELKMSFRYTYEASELLQIVQQGCPADIQIHMGICQNPQDANGGWNKIAVLEGGQPTDYTIDKVTALEPSERATPMEGAPFVGTNYYEILPMVYGLEAGVQVVQEMISIAVVDNVQCGNCGLPSDGCQVVFAVSLAHAGSPGLGTQVLYTQNGGGTWFSTNINSTALPISDNAVDIAGVGSNIIVTSGEGVRIVYTSLASILNNTETWTSVVTGLVTGPTCIFTLAPTLTWIGGLGGYMYFTSDPTSGVVVQDAANASATDYTCIHGIDAQNLIAVGKTNAVVTTINGGRTWQAVTGPNPATNLLTCYMVTQSLWWVGDASGKLWYTENGGASWTQKGFPGSGSGTVNSITFGVYGEFPAVGYLAHSTGTVGSISRSIDGGATWYNAPELGQQMPSFARVDKIATCGSNPNTLYASGLATGGTDGIILKGQG